MINHNKVFFQINSASWKDLGPLRRIEKECFPLDAWPLLDLIAILTFNYIVRLKAVVAGEVVGFIAAERKPQKNVGWIATIGVLPKYQRKGIASALLEVCEANLNVDYIRLCVRSGNKAAIRLYEDAGYRRIDIWPGYYQDGANAYVYEKKCSHPL